MFDLCGGSSLHYSFPKAARSVLVGTLYNPISGKGSSASGHTLRDGSYYKLLISKLIRISISVSLPYPDFKIGICWKSATPGARANFEIGAEGRMGARTPFRCINFHISQFNFRVAFWVKLTPTKIGRWGR